MVGRPPLLFFLNPDQTGFGTKDQKRAAHGGEERAWRELQDKTAHVTARSPVQSGIFFWFDSVLAGLGSVFLAREAFSAIFLLLVFFWCFLCVFLVFCCCFCCFGGVFLCFLFFLFFVFSRVSAKENCFFGAGMSKTGNSRSAPAPELDLR